MTKAQDSPVTRETNVSEKGRPLIVTLKGSTMELRFKGLRGTMLLDYEVALALIRRLEFEAAGGKMPGKLKGRDFHEVKVITRAELDIALEKLAMEMDPGTSTLAFSEILNRKLFGVR